MEIATEPTAAPGDSTERPICAWCGAHARATGGRLAWCERCGAASTHPPADDDELERAYAGWYRPESGRFSAGGDRILALSRSQLARRVDRIAPAGPVLDVGAGDGTLLRALRARGREAVGLERDGAGEGIEAREIADFDERAGEWAALIFWHSLEHLRDPAGAIDRAWKLLMPGGSLIVAVPNLASAQARIFGARWFHLDLPRHFVHLPAGALRAGLEQRGFAVERVSDWRGGQLVFGWLHGAVGALPGHPDLYSAIRRPEAQGARIAGIRRAAVLVAATAISPLGVLAAGTEVLSGHGGTVYVEGRRR